MRRLSLAAIFCTLTLLVYQVAAADTQPDPTTGSTNPAIQTDNLLLKLEAQWLEVTTAMLVDDLTKLGQAVVALNDLKINSGFEALEGYSLKLITHGRRKLKQYDAEAASIYLKYALQLSPRSPTVLLHALPLVQGTQGSSAALSYLFKALGWVWYEPLIVIKTVKGIVYPALWALTFGLYLTMILVFLNHIHEILRAAAHFTPAMFRGFVTPIIILISILAPCLFGPLWCVICWACVILLFLPERKWIGCAAGVLLLLWGLAVPFREGLNSWLSQDGVLTMLRVASGSFQAADREVLQRISKERDRDGVVAYVYAQLLRKYAEFPAAEQAFLRAEDLLGKRQPWTRAQRGIIAFLNGKLKDADQLFAEAERLGLDSAEFYLNYSKVKFEMLDTVAARSYVEKANALNPDLATILSEREQHVGVRGNAAVAELNLPNTMIISSAFYESDDRVAKSKVGALFLPGVAPQLLSVLGVLFIVLCISLRKQKKPRRLSAYYPNFQVPKTLQLLIYCIPGAAWIRAGRPLLALSAISAAILLAMPILEWPRESAMLTQAVPQFYSLYCMAVALFLGALAYVAYHTAEEAE